MGTGAIEAMRERDLEHLERLGRLRPIDDDFMRVFFRDDLPLV